MGEYNRFIWPTPLEMQYSHFCKAGWLCLNVFWGFIARYCPTEYSCKNTPMWAQLLVAVYKNWVFFNRLMKWVRSMTYTLHSRGWLWQPSTSKDFEWSLFAPNCQFKAKSIMQLRMGLSCCSRWMFNLNRSPLNSWYINSTVVQGVWLVCPWDVVGDC